VIRFTSTEAASVTLWVGDTLVVDAPTPPEGTPSTIARDLRWSSEGTDVATVSPRGVVTARTAGTARIVAWRRVGETITPVVVRPAIRGRVVTADDAPVRSRVVARAGAWADTTWTDADGRFVFRPPPDRSIDGPASVLVEPDGETHTPALLADTPVERLADVDVVLLPKRLRLTTGSYAGETIAIRPSVAQGRAREALRLWHITHPNRRGVVDDGQPVGWEPARLPLPLAFDHRGVGAVISSYDSASFWAIARQLERDWGAPLFRPATLAPNDSEFAGITVAVEPRLRSEGLTTTGWNGDGDVYDAVVAVRTRALLADPNVVTHELMHALGVGHAQGGLSSVMHPVADASSPGRATPDDVAYGRLLYAVRARSRPGRTVVGVAGAAAVDRAP
jgi:hypothetical protein